MFASFAHMKPIRMVIYAFIANGGLGESSEKQVPDLRPYPKAKRSALRRQLPQGPRPPRACNLEQGRFDSDDDEPIGLDCAFDQGSSLDE